MILSHGNFIKLVYLNEDMIFFYYRFSIAILTLVLNIDCDITLPITLKIFITISLDPRSNPDANIGTGVKTNQLQSIVQQSLSNKLKCVKEIETVVSFLNLNL